MNKNNEQQPMMLFLYQEGAKSFKDQWHDFKYSYRIADVRNAIAKTLETCLCSDYPNFDEARERDDIALFFCQLMSLLEAKYKKDIEQDEQYRKFALAPYSNNNSNTD